MHVIGHGTATILKEYVKILDGSTEVPYGKHGDDATIFHYEHKLLPIIWGILAAIKENTRFRMTKSTAKNVGKTVETLSKFSKTSSIWSNEWQNLCAGLFSIL